MLKSFLGPQRPSVACVCVCVCACPDPSLKGAVGCTWRQIPAGAFISRASDHEEAAGWPCKRRLTEFSIEDRTAGSPSLSISLGAQTLVMKAALRSQKASVKTKPSTKITNFTHHRHQNLTTSSGKSKSSRISIL